MILNLILQNNQVFLKKFYFLLVFNKILARYFHVTNRIDKRLLIVNQNYYVKVKH